jgi:septum formation protein
VKAQAATVSPSEPTAGVLVLASASAARLALLRAAGIRVEPDPAGVDEAEVKASLRGEGAGPQIAAEALSEIKAQRVSRRRAGALVLGADQILECEGRWFDKPAGRAEARTQLLALRGRAHRLVSSAVAVRDGMRLWHHTAEAELTMRPFSDEFLEAYLAAAAPDALRSVGAYQLEGLGVQLFSRIRGDYFVILGLPLMPLLEFLRRQGVLRP